MLLKTKNLGGNIAPPELYTKNCFLKANQIISNWIPYPPETPLVEPQELDFLGSVKLDFCVRFKYMGRN